MLVPPVVWGWGLPWRGAGLKAGPGPQLSEPGVSAVREMRGAVKSANAIIVINNNNGCF